MTGTRNEAPAASLTSWSCSPSCSPTTTSPAPAAGLHHLRAKYDLIGAKRPLQQLHMLGEDPRRDDFTASPPHRPQVIGARLTPSSYT